MPIAPRPFGAFMLSVFFLPLGPMFGGKLDCLLPVYEPRSLHVYSRHGTHSNRGLDYRYNVGILASVLAHPGFKHVLDDAEASLGLITGIYYIGTWLSYIFVAHPAADKLGRRYAALGGMLVLCVGQALQASATGPSAFRHILAGRIISGLGTGVVSTSVPLYQRYRNKKQSLGST